MPPPYAAPAPTPGQHRDALNRSVLECIFAMLLFIGVILAFFLTTTTLSHRFEEPEDEPLPKGKRRRRIFRGYGTAIIIGPPIVGQVPSFTQLGGHEKSRLSMESESDHTDIEAICTAVGHPGVPL